MFKQATLWVLSLLSFSTYSADVTTISQQELLQSNMDNLVIVDVRTANEFQQGHVPNAKNVPLQSILDNPAVLAPSTGKKSFFTVVQATEQIKRPSLYRTMA